MAFLRAIVAACALAAVCSPSLAQETLLERGRYLVETVAFWGVCHNSRVRKARRSQGWNWLVDG